MFTVIFERPLLPPIKLNKEEAHMFDVVCDVLAHLYHNGEPITKITIENNELPTVVPS